LSGAATAQAAGTCSRARRYGCPRHPRKRV